MTNVFSGRPPRGLANRFAVETSAWSDMVPDFPLPAGDNAPLRAAAERQGSCNFTPLWSGQAVALSRQMPARALMKILVMEAFERFCELGRVSPQPAASHGDAATA